MLLPTAGAIEHPNIFFNSIWCYS